MRFVHILAAALALAPAVAACDGDAPFGEDAAQDTPALSAQGARPESRTFRDWSTACDNGLSCFAFAGPVEGGMGWLKVAMEGGPEAAPQITTGYWPGDGEGGGAMRLTIDGRSWPLKAIKESLGVVAAPDAPEVLTALAAARTVRVSEGEDGVDLSPSGATAALLWIDERQGRLGTTNALVRRGDRAAGLATPPPPLPHVTPAAAVDQTGFAPDGVDQALAAPLAALPAVAECRNNLEWNPELFKAVTAARLAPDRELWGVPCDAGAYNLIIRYFLTGAGGADPRPLTFQGAVGEPQDTLTNPEYDPETRTLTQFAKGRGLGDCGVIQSWVWTGRDFVLSADSSMGHCWGVPIDQWPTLWRSR